MTGMQKNMKWTEWPTYWLKQAVAGPSEHDQTIWQAEAVTPKVPGISKLFVYV